MGTVVGEISQVSVLLSGPDGQKSFDLPVTGGVFRVALNLAIGSTVVRVTVADGQAELRITRFHDNAAEPTNWFVHSVGDLVVDCASCHPVGRAGGPDYRRVVADVSCRTEQCHATMGRKKFVHSPVKEGLCLECHNPHGSERKDFTTAFRDADMCFRCHEDEKKLFHGKQVHFPVAKGECLSCHDPHETNLEFHLKGNTVRELCAGCHPLAMQEYQHMHEPFAQGDCVACHAPHVSDFPKLLTGVGKDVCLVCHEIRKNEFKSRYVHEPVSKDCGLCHDPHGSPMMFHLRVPKDDKGKYAAEDGTVKDSCLLCHRTLDSELVDEIEHAKVTHKPVVDGQCTACHTPHSTNYPKQLKGPVAEVCFSCHKEMGEKIKSSKYLHGPLRTGDCSLCHKPHGAQYQHLLRQEFAEDFYGEFSPEKYKLCFDCHNVNSMIDPESHETGFRNGDINLHSRHVVMGNRGRNCKTCHDVHASDQENHIRRKIPYQGRHTISLKFAKTETGGGCVVGCHRPRSYDRIKSIDN